MSEKYNGWTNRETWAVALWLGNDREVKEAAVWHVEFGLKELDYLRGGFGQRSLESDLVVGGDALNDYYNHLVEEPEFDSTLMERDVGSYWRVNWAEVADEYVTEIRENNKHLEVQI